MTPSRWSQRIWPALRAAAAVAALGALSWPSGAEASELALERGGVSFSALDGGAADGDGVADGVLTLDRLSLSGNAEIVVDVPTARFAVAGDVLLRGTSAIRADGAAAPRVEIEAGGDIAVTGDAAVRADAAAGGAVRLCAGGDLEVDGRAAISASATTASGAGGSIHLEAGDRLAIGPAAAVSAHGTSGGRVELVSCGAGTTGPGASITGAALAIEGRVEATGSGTGGTVDVEARQGGVGFGPGPALVDASGGAGGGAVSVTAAAEVSPAVPPAQPSAVVTTGSPSVRPCDCAGGGEDDPVGVGDLLVAAEVDRPTGLAGTLFTFSGRVVQTNAPVNDWQWTLSDGRVLSGPSISVSFPAPGLYGATVVATDDDGNSVESETGVVVFDPATQAPPEFGLPPLVGDVDGDGAITLRDAHRVAKHAGRLETLAPTAVPAADVDLDGEVTPADGLLLGQAVAANATLPTVLLPARGAPGARVNLISPELLDPTALVEIEVGESQWVQTPLRAARGYATFMIPLDATLRDSVAVVPGPVEVRVLRDGVVVDTLTFEVEAPPPLPADPKAELISFLDDYVELFALSREAVLRLADFAGVDGDERELLIATYTAAEQDTAAKVARLEALLAAPGGEEVAEVFFRFANANGYGELRQQMDELLAPGGAAAGLRAAAASTAQIDEILAIVCAVRDASELLSAGSDLLSTGCDALLVAAVIAAAFPGDGPAGEAAALAAWASACGAIEATVELALLINELVGSIEPDLRFEGSPTSPGAGESVELRAEIELAGLDDICAFTVGKARSEMIEELAENAVERLLRKKLALKAISRAIRFFSEDLFEELEDRLEELVVRAIDHTAIGNLLEELTNKVCDIFQAGVPLLDDLGQIMQGPDPNVGTLTVNGDGTASYTCPDDSSQTADSVTFTARREICGENVEKTVTVTCQSRPVTITIGDNGTANDDIYEVRIEGETVLTSSVPVRSISTTVQLPVGDHVVEMIGRAAPDGIGTYFIRFSGATVIGGAPLSGTDLTPGVVKTFVIRVQ